MTPRVGITRRFGKGKVLYSDGGDLVVGGVEIFNEQREFRPADFMQRREGVPRIDGAFAHELARHVDLELGHFDPMAGARQQSADLFNERFVLRRGRLRRGNGRRRPLNGVRGVGERGGGDEERGERQGRYGGGSREGGTHLLGVIDDILDLDRIGAGKTELHIERLALRPLLELVLERLNPLAAASGVRVYSSLAESPEIQTDPRRLSQIVSNLLANAIQFTSDGGQVTVAAKPFGRSVEIAVTDTGVGIPLADQERIFDPFAQVDSGLSRSHSGTGLGLSLSRRLASLLGGELTVSSVVGSGSTFRLVLPLARSV